MKNLEVFNLNYKEQTLNIILLDIYTHVANKVQEKINNDALNAESKYHLLAKKFVGNIKRKIVK